MSKHRQGNYDQQVAHQIAFVFRLIDKHKLPWTEFRLDKGRDMLIHIPSIWARRKLASLLRREVGRGRTPGDYKTGVYEVLLNTLVCIYDKETFQLSVLRDR